MSSQMPNRKMPTRLTLKANIMMIVLIIIGLLLFGYEFKEAILRIIQPSYPLSPFNKLID